MRVFFIRQADPHLGVKNLNLWPCEVQAWASAVKEVMFSLLLTWFSGVAMFNALGNSR